MSLKLEELEVYKLSEEIADVVWSICSKWEFFARDTIGKQLVRAADSIGANIAEGYGRFAYKENVHFCYYARGSLMETRHFLRRAKMRKLLTAEQEAKIRKIIQPLGPKLNAYVRSIKSQLGTPK
jgi:four helix bundle protein